MILFDTSVLSRIFRRGQPGHEERRLQAAVGDLMESDAPLGIPAIVLQEVLSGIRNPRQFADLERKLLTSFLILHPTTEDYIEAARLRNRCLAMGFSASGPDCLIASLAIAGDHDLFALDQDFHELTRCSPLRLYTSRRGA